MTVVLAELGRDPEAPALVLFGSRARGEARPSSDLDLLLIVAAALTPERGRALRSRARALLTSVLAVDLLPVELLADGQPPLSHDLGRLQQLAGVSLPEDLLELEEFALKARYSPEETPLPASRERWLGQILALALRQGGGRVGEAPPPAPDGGAGGGGGPASAVAKAVGAAVLCGARARLAFRV